MDFNGKPYLIDHLEVPRPGPFRLPPLKIPLNLFSGWGYTNQYPTSHIITIIYIYIFAWMGASFEVATSCPNTFQCGAPCATATLDGHGKRPSRVQREHL